MTQLRTRTVASIGAITLAVFVVLLVAGVVPRIRASRDLASAAQSGRTAVTTVIVATPQPAADADLSLAATTQALQDATIYARTSGYIKRRFVDIGDRVRAGQLLAEIASPEIDQQLEQANADYRQSEKMLDQQKATLDLSRATMARYLAADAERAVAGGGGPRRRRPDGPGSRGGCRGDRRIERGECGGCRSWPSFERVVARFRHRDPAQRRCRRSITAGSPTTNAASAPTSVGGAPGGLFEIAQIDVLRVLSTCRRRSTSPSRPASPSNSAFEAASCNPWPLRSPVPQMRLSRQPARC